jgi:hypothetical protein
MHGAAAAGLRRTAGARFSRGRGVARQRQRWLCGRTDVAAGRAANGSDERRRRVHTPVQRIGNRTTTGASARAWASAQCEAQSRHRAERRPAGWQGNGLRQKMRHRRRGTEGPGAPPRTGGSGGGEGAARTHVYKPTRTQHSRWVERPARRPTHAATFQRGAPCCRHRAIQVARKRAATTSWRRPQ